MASPYTQKIKVIDRNGDVHYHYMHYDCMPRDIMSFVYDKYSHYDYELIES